MTATRVYYSTLDLVKSEIDTTTTDDDPIVLDYLGQVSQRIDAAMSDKHKPYFAPALRQERWRLNSEHIDDGGLVYRALFPIQAITALTVNDADNLANIEVDFENQGALRWIGASGNFANLIHGADPGARMNITGTWGFSLDYANAWVDSGDTVEDNPLSDSATTLTVNASTNFAEGQLIQIESEWCLVTEIASETTLTIQRGSHGTAAASHAQNTSIEVFAINETVQRITAREVSLWYERRGSFQTTTFEGVGVVTYPEDFLSEVTRALKELTRAD